MVDTFDMESSDSSMHQQPQVRQRAGRMAQFSAVLRKNFILQTRSRKALFGIGGPAALILEVLIPALFFILMCIPKYYVPLLPSPQQVSPAYSLDSQGWANAYHGAATYISAACLLCCSCQAKHVEQHVIAHHALPHHCHRI